MGIRKSRDEFFESANIEFKINPKRLSSEQKKLAQSRATYHKVSPWSPFPAEPPFSDIVLHVGQAEAVLKSLDPNKATGPDEIPARILKETATTIAPLLCKLFNRSLGEGYIPSEWKLANVVPVYKKDEKDHVENYRPISLLCIISKVLELGLLNRINDRLEDLIADCQHGFRSGRSCVTNLLETLDYIGTILDRAGQVDCVYLDKSKAFDKVRHDLLVEKLRDAGFGGNLLT